MHTDPGRKQYTQNQRDESDEVIFVDDDLYDLDEVENILQELGGVMHHGSNSRVINISACLIYFLGVNHITYTFCVSVETSRNIKV